MTRGLRQMRGAQPWIALIAAVVRDAPPLRDALCSTRDPRMFDGLTERDRERAIAVCRRCPVLADCRDWYSSLPRSRLPRGVVAGRFRPGASP